MKKAILLIILLSTINAAFSQYTDISYATTKKEMNYSPGDYLKKGSNSILTGIALSAIGGGMIYYGLTSNSSSSRESNLDKSNTGSKDFFVYAGSGLAVVGVIMNIRGIVLIGKAGDKFNGVVLQPRTNGMSLVFKF